MGEGDREMIPILCPSKGRCNSVLTTKLIPSLKLVVPETEAYDYRRHNPDTEVLGTPPDVRGIVKTRQWILDHFDECFMIDDDVRTVRKNYVDDDESEINDPGEIIEIINEDVYIAREIGSKMFSFSKIVNPLAFGGQQLFLNTGYMNASYCGFLKGHGLSYDLTMDEGEDHYISCLNMFKNRYCLIDLRYSFMTADNFKSQGGCALYRTRDKMIRNTLHLRELFGEVVMLKKTQQREEKRQHGRAQPFFPLLTTTAMEISEEILKSVFVGIPSLSRPEYITKKTMKWVKDIPFAHRIFVEPHERFLYKQYNGDCVEILPKSGMGLMFSLNCIREYAREHGYKYLFQLDDDVDGFERLDTTDPVQAFCETAVDLYNAMEDFPKIGGIRFTQYRYWLYSKKRMFKWTHLNKPLQGICFLRLSAVPRIDDGMKEFTDTITSLYLWKNGFVTLNYGLSGLRVVQNANKGGCQTHDRKQEALDTIALLKKDFPLVTEKAGTSWFGVDVDISAYNEKYGYHCINCGDKNLHNCL